jgi:hypothetical protein
MAKSINITYALIGACHTTFTITDNLGNVVAQGVTGAELTQDFNVLVDDAATSITVHSENCSVTHNLDLPECLLAGIEVTKECSCYVSPESSSIRAGSKGSNYGGYGEYPPDKLYQLSPIWDKCVGGYTFDGYYTTCSDLRAVLLWPPDACDDKRVEIILYRGSDYTDKSIILTSSSFYASSDELKAGWMVPSIIQWNDGSSSPWSPNSGRGWLAGVHFKTECGEYKMYNYATYFETYAPFGSNGLY